MADTEGVIKYQLDFQPDLPIATSLDELNAWRNILHELHLVGRDAARYQGYSYGNLSQRLANEAFIITGSQTGGVYALRQDHYVTVEHCDIANNRVVARGPIEPSSEALTHAMIYQLDASLLCVMHVHDPLLWRYALSKGLPATGVDVEYGTPRMAAEVERLFREKGLADIGLLAMAGHEDGIISFGDSIDQAGYRLLKLWRNSRGY